MGGTKRYNFLHLALSIVFMLKVISFFNTPHVSALNCTWPTAGEDSDRCPAGWTWRDPEYCVFYSPKRRTFNESREFCRSTNNSDVASTMFPSTTHYIYLYITRGWGYMSVWLALNDFDGNGKWTWAYQGVKLRMHWFENWRTSIRHRTAHPCAYHDFKDDTWKDDLCENPHYVMCQVESKLPGDACPVGWNLIYGKKCGRFYPQKQTWQDAIQTCNRANAHLPYIENRNDSKGLQNFMRWYQSSWLGITREAQGQGKSPEWRWLGGEKIEPPIQRWKTNEPNPDPSLSCALLYQHGKWQAADCATKLPVVCMKQSAAGPGHTSMTVQYHRSDQVFYLGEPANVTCTAIGAVGDVIRWLVTFGHGIKTDVNYKYITNQHEVVVSDEGLCVKRVTSTLSFPHLGLTPGHISCFARELPSVHKNDYVRCQKYSDTMRMCDYTATNVVDGPKGSPELNVTYPGQPGLVPSGATVTVTCTVKTGPDGTLMWVLVSLNKAYVLENNDELVKSYDQTIDGDLVSELQIKLQPAETGTSLACFAYDAEKYTDDQMCLDTDKYCTQTPELKVKEDKIEYGVWFTFPRWGFFIAALVLFFILALFKKTVQTVGQTDEGLALQRCEKRPQLTSNF